MEKTSFLFDLSLLYHISSSLSAKIIQIKRNRQKEILVFFHGRAII